MKPSRGSIYRLTMLSFLCLLLLFVAASPRVMPHVVWKWHEGAMDPTSLLFEYAVTTRFENAVNFFYYVTEIEPKHVGMEYIGLTWKPEAVRDLEEWRAWYRVNSHRLYWNVINGDVSVRD